MSEREASEAGAASLWLDSQVNQPLGGELGGGPGGWVGGGSTSVWLGLFIHGSPEEAEGLGGGSRRPS